MEVAGVYFLKLLINMKLIMKSWRGFLGEQKIKNEKEAALIWIDPNFRPIDKLKKDSVFRVFLQYITPEYIPQGHAGIVLIKKEKNKNFILCTSLEFGISSSGNCSEKNPKGLLDKLRKKLGLFVPGEVTVRKRRIRIKETDVSLLDSPKDLISMILKKMRGNWPPSRARTIGYIEDIDYDKAYNYGVKEGRCRLYTIIPHLLQSKGDNCGSYVIKVAAAGKNHRWAKTTGDAIADQVLAPDELLSKLNEAGWIKIFQLPF